MVVNYLTNLKKHERVTFTSRASYSLLNWIDQEARDKDCSKADIIEAALFYYKRRQKREAMIEAAKRSAEDPEFNEIAEWGLIDYAEQLKKY